MPVDFLDSFGPRKPVMKTLTERPVAILRGERKPCGMAGCVYGSLCGQGGCSQVPAHQVEKFAAMEREHAKSVEGVCCVCGGREIDGRCDNCVRLGCDA